MRQELKSFLATSLSDRVDYLSTSYRKAHDYLGHAQILVDGVPVTNHCDYSTWWGKRVVAPDFDRETTDFKQYDFVHAAGWYLNSPIEESLAGVEDEPRYYHTAILRQCLAVMDKRVGKRRLRALADEFRDSPGIVRYFYALRCEAEAILVDLDVPTPPFPPRPS
jgi:hypothetical protein